MSIRRRAWMRGRATLGGVGTALVLGAGCATWGSPDTPPGAAGLRPTDSLPSEVALETFDVTWQRIHETYYDSTFGGLDWTAVREELRPRAGATTSSRELRAILQEMLGRLGDSHFGVIPAEFSEALDPEGSGDLSGDVGMDVRWMADEVVVTLVAPGGPAHGAGVRPGWILRSVDGREVREWAAGVPSSQDTGRAPSIHIWMVGSTRHALRGEEGSPVTLEFLDGRDRPVSVDLVRAVPQGEPIRLGNLPTLFAEVETTRHGLPPECAGVLRFNAWMAPLSEPLLRALDDFAECRGVVLDLRGNIGGLMAMVPVLAGALLPERALVGTLVTRDRATSFYAAPRQATFEGRPTRPFAGSVALLVDEMSISAAEVFAAGLQGNGRARVFGTRTAGEVLPARTARLPNGDVLLHAYADFTGPDGTRLEGTGVVPDEVVASSRIDLLAGRDRPLEAALAWIDAVHP